MSEANKNIALLIDADNASADHLEQVLGILAELGTVTVRRAYGNWAKPELNKWVALLHRFAVEPQQQFDLTKGKNATDMKMTIDAMDLLASSRVGGFGIMSSDSDFMPLALRLKQDGLPVYGFGRATTPEGFRGACTRFIDVGGLAEPDGPAAEPSTAAAVSPVDADLLKLLSNAWKAAKRDEKGFARLGEVGQLAGNQSSFDARSYGFARLSDLIAATPQFAIDRRDDGIWIKRVR